ncbi:MAG TPA: cell wall hydrolase [Alphaproteobacteria bacterium]|jgi:hypothetical protein
MDFTPRDRDVLARTVYGEARGERWLGKAAVAWSVLNRVAIDLRGDGRPDWWGEGIAAVCLAPWQYSAWNENDPNREALLRVTVADPFFRECLAVVDAVLAGDEPDPTDGATHYKVTKLAWPKDWGPQEQAIVKPVIGGHSFYVIRS